MAKKILIIDDEQDFVDMLKMRLEANGYEVVTADDGVTGLQRWKEKNPDIILLDIMMPQLGGYSFVQDSKTTPGLKQVPIIVLTAKPGMEDIFEMEGVHDYLVKPCEDKDLLDKIRKHIGDAR